MDAASSILATCSITCLHLSLSIVIFSNEDICDLHHIIPVSKNGSDEHSNLTYLCPNHHRLAQRGKIQSSELITFQKQVGDEWKKYYLG